MTIQRILPLAAALFLGGCAGAYTYQSGDGSGDYYYGNPRVEYRYHTPSGVYGSYSPYGYGYGYGAYGHGYGGYYGAWDPYRHSRYYVGPRYYHGPYVYGPYGYPSGYAIPNNPPQRYVPHQPRPNHGYRPYRPPGVTGPNIGVSPPPPPSPAPQSFPTPRSSGNATEGRTERARIRTQGKEE
jgi:hypothetical protein